MKVNIDGDHTFSLAGHCEVMPSSYNNASGSLMCSGCGQHQQNSSAVVKDCRVEKKYQKTLGIAKFIAQVSV
jgi:hypothetical protein